MKKEIFLIEWSYYSCMDSGGDIEAIYSTYENALNHIKKKKESFPYKRIKQHINKQGQKEDFWTDGDYWVRITNGFLDCEELYTGDHPV